MFFHKPAFSTRSVPSATLRLLFIQRQLRLHCHSISVFHFLSEPCKLSNLRNYFRKAVYISSGPAWPVPSVLGVRSVFLKTYTSSSTSKETGESLKVEVKGREMQIPWLWLRDHCRCPTCYNAATFQKNVEKISLENLVLLESGVDGDTLSVQWQDGHISRYSMQWLADNFSTAGPQPERFVWDGPRMRSEPLPVTAFEHHMNTDGLKNTLKNIIKYGFCIVDGAPVSEQGTEMVTSRISFPLETVYGKVNTMVSGEMTHADTAYTSLPLGAHTDTTYFNTPAGVQVFHCLEHLGKGGRTLLVDGFHAAEELQRSDPKAFECLTRTPVPHEYIDKSSSYHIYAASTVLSTDVMTGQLTHIRFNPYDRAALRTVPAEAILQFYNSYEALTQIIRREQNEFWLKLNPGMVLLVDNWRVMHGRSSFTGRRTLCTAYLPRDEWTSRARVLGLM